ncbi:hypothetical protein [Kitasatospora sp. NPDC094015]|uniref:hypothetical protein n=1 Tax=Kitasatospora sp. NPDC094015 TaxID=3155205 RepID=UPI0033194E18
MRGINGAVRALAHIIAGILVIWILMDLLDANSGNTLVGWFHSAADWLAGWSRGLFQVSNRTLQVLLDYGLPAIVYAAIGNLIARRVAE